MVRGFPAAGLLAAGLLLVAALGLSCPAAAQSVEIESGTDAAGSSQPELAWRNSVVSWGHHITKNSLDEGAQLSHNPTYVQSLTLAPRWYFSDEISLRLRQDFALELTQPDLQRDRALVLDTVLDGVYAGQLPGWGLDVSAGPRLTVPLSNTSRAAERVLGVGGRADLGRSFDGVLEGLTLGASGRAVHHLALSNVTASDDTVRCRLAESDGPSVSSLYCGGGAGSVEDDFSLTLQADLGLGAGLEVGLSFGWMWQLAAPVEQRAVIETLTGQEIVQAQGATRWRNSTLSALSLSYALVDWLQVSTSVSTATGQLNPDGTRRNPFWGPDTRLSLGVSLLPDKLVVSGRR